MKYGKVVEMKICTYTVKTDKGFAPNPFYRYCTLAACTPNHMNARLDSGDYIVGFFTNRDEPYLLFWMKIDEVLDFDAYFHDSRFQRKKPNLKGTWISRCGDNLYYKNERDKWEQIPTVYHDGAKSREKDTRHAIVYLGRCFSYFGENSYCPENRLPKKIQAIYKGGRGIKYIRDTATNFDQFLDWLHSKPLGRRGDPRDKEDRQSCTPLEQYERHKIRTKACT